jgi:hypothetical protein
MAQVNPLAAALLGFADPGSVPQLMRYQQQGAAEEAEAAALKAKVDREKEAQKHRGLAVQALRERLEAGMHPEAAFLDAFRSGALSDAVALDPDFAEVMGDLKKALMKPAPQYQALSPGQIPGVVDPDSGEFRQTGAAAPFAPTAPAAVIMPGDTRRQQLEAERAVRDVPAELRTVREQQANVDTMLRLLEQGVETGKWPDAVKQFVQTRFGVDIGSDPGLQTLRSLAQSEALTAATNLKGALSDRDVQFLQDLGAMTARGTQGNISVLKARRAINERAAKELQAEQDYYQRNGSLAGFDQWLQGEAQKWGPVVPDEVVREITTANAAGAVEEATAFKGLAEAVQKGDAAAVNQALVSMGQEAVSALPQAVRDAARRVLEGR